MNRKEIHIITPRFDSFGLRNTKSDITDVIQCGNLTQIYKGPITRGCYHGKGLIIWIKKDKKKIFEGYFHVNQIHGYGRMTYENGLIFEGLYKNGMRFGPGVETHPDQHQEVGFWIGTHILRLSCHLTTDTVPSYDDASSVYTKIKLLQFKHYIDLTQPPHSIINIRDNSENYLNEKYSFPFVRHSNSLFFDTQAFHHEFTLNSVKPKNYKEIYENQFKSGCNLQDLILKNYLKISKEKSQSNKEFLTNCGIYIDNQYELLNSKSWTIIHEQHENVKLENSKRNENEIHHSNILAYNNNTLDKMMLAHAYQQRFGEKSLLYNLNSIWNEKRNIYMPSQSQELGVVHLLSKLDLSPEKIINLISHYNIDSDAADSRGNTRLMISSANDQHEIIKCMVNLGASLECYNDDGFTPLNLTLMRYICLLNDIKQWNAYLIPHVNLKFNIKKGDQDIILKNIQEINFFQSENLLNMKFTEKNVEIEDMNSTLKKLPNTKKSMIDSVRYTIGLLINMGAKATTCIVPKPSIHLALMTINPTILNSVFKAGGSPYYTLSNEDFKLNLLHMAVMMPTNYSIIKCIEILILHHVNPNSKALPIFSVFRHQFPWIKITKDKAKPSMTPLDILCLKKNDYKINGKFAVDEQSENELASILYDVTERSSTYCGFKPIALAMLSGKLNLTEIFINKDRTIINEKIPGFGTLLTLLVNPNYNFNLSYKKINKLLDLLLKSNSNPLKIVKVIDEEFRGNIYEYCYVLSTSEKLNQEKHIFNYTKIVEKLENAGRKILDIIYAKRAKHALLKTYKNRRTSPFLHKKMAMLLWIDSDLRAKVHQVDFENISNYEKINFKIVGNNNPLGVKEKIKNEAHVLDFPQIKKYSIIPSQSYLTQEEILVCYECLKQLPNKIETCSSCYFALLCSENCKRQHKKQRCIMKKVQYRLIKIQEKYTRRLQNYKHNSLSSISMRSLSLLLLQSSKLFLPSIKTKSNLSVFSIKSNQSFTDFTSNNLHQSQRNIIEVIHTQKYKKNDNLDDQSNHFIIINQSISSIHNTNTYISDKNELNLYSQDLFYDKIDNNLNKIQSYKNKLVEKMKKSTIFVVNLRNRYKKNYWKMEQKPQNQERNLQSNNKLSDVLISSIKYRMVKFPGCKRPVFMFID